MQFPTVFALIVSLAIPALSASVLITVLLVYDTMYDNASSSLSSTACSPSAYTTFGQVPTYPRIGGAFAVEKFNSTKCGSCWSLEYVRPGTGAFLTYITVVNSAPAGFVTLLETMTGLLGVPRSQIPANVKVTAVQIAASFCA